MCLCGLLVAGRFASSFYRLSQVSCPYICYYVILEPKFYTLFAYRGTVEIGPNQSEKHSTVRSNPQTFVRCTWKISVGETHGQLHMETLNTYLNSSRRTTSWDMPRVPNSEKQQPKPSNNPRKHIPNIFGKERPTISKMNRNGLHLHPKSVSSSHMRYVVHMPICAIPACRLCAKDW